MKKLSIILIIGAIGVTGACSGASNPLCAPANAWHAPAHRCATAAAPVVVEEVEEEPEEVAEAPVPEPEPMVKVTEDRIEILQKVQFETGSDEIRSVSFGLLDEVAATLNDNPDITKVAVEGHTDSNGSAKLNRRLSKGRAKSVLRYLVEKGVDSKRLQSNGYGPDQPIADNDSDEGREQNRRVEFKILSHE